MVSPLQSGGCHDPRWLKKGGCPLILSERRAVRVFATDILQQITIIYAFKFVLETFQNYNLSNYDICNNEK